jgi:hypothetical protein
VLSSLDPNAFSRQLRDRRDASQAVALMTLGALGAAAEPEADREDWFTADPKRHPMFRALLHVLCPAVFG